MRKIEKLPGPVLRDDDLVEIDVEQKHRDEIDCDALEALGGCPVLVRGGRTFAVISHDAADRDAIVARVTPLRYSVPRRGDARSFPHGGEAPDPAPARPARPPIFPAHGDR